MSEIRAHATHESNVLVSYEHNLTNTTFKHPGTYGFTEFTELPPRAMDVCVIGAGLSGLLVLRHLRYQSGINRLVAYEKCGDIGGQWLYTDQTGEDAVSSVYKDL